MPVALNCREYGEGPPLILLHGLFGSSRNWHSLAQRFGEHHHVLAVDLRNHGDSPWADDMDYPVLAADLKQLVETKRLAQPCVLGHSMGGKTAMALALCYPQLVEHLIVVDIAPVDYADSLAPYVRAMQEIDLSAVKRRSDADLALRETVPQQGIRAFLLQNLVQQDGAWRWRINLERIAKNMPLLSGFPDDLKTLSFAKAALFVTGEASDYVSEQDFAGIRRMFPHVSFASIARAGHWVHAEQPGRFYDAVLEFLR